MIALGLGLFIYSSLSTPSHATRTYNSNDSYFIVFYEIIMFSILFFYLKSRRWKWSDFNTEFKLNMLAVAAVLVILRYISGYTLNVLLNFLNIVDFGSFNKPEIHLEFNLLSSVLIIIVNSIYEEFILIGYLFKRLEKLYPWLIVLISFIIRASYHTYQGWANLTMVLAMALVFGVYYLRFKKLWPLILAHGLGNTLMLANEHYKLINF